MMMHNENGSHISNIEPSLGDAASRTIASINYIKSTVDDQQIWELCPMGAFRRAPPMSSDRDEAGSIQACFSGSAKRVVAAVCGDATVALVILCFSRNNFEANAGANKIK
jgi:hypothetical protein